LELGISLELGTWDLELPAQRAIWDFRRKRAGQRAGFFAFASLLHSCAHFRHASAHFENASIFECLSHAVASSSHAWAQTPQIGYAYFEPRSSNCVVSVAIRAQSRAVTITDATVFTSGWANPAVTKCSQRRRATFKASIASLNFGGHIDDFLG
jgi:hypothetical protein